mmetsp:Transcript_31635/g.30941  ORF Transcript_31635/g.30941 Transcript_31635/m.30941 type:complete len:96 (+) Transcript_31635:255-542(+)
MMFDEERQCFKIVPIEKHFKFQKIVENKKKKEPENDMGIEGLKKPKVTKISEIRNTIKGKFKTLNQSNIRTNDEVVVDGKKKKKEFTDKELDFVD